MGRPPASDAWAFQVAKGSLCGPLHHNCNGRAPVTLSCSAAAVQYESMVQAALLDRPGGILWMEISPSTFQPSPFSNHCWPNPPHMKNSMEYTI